MDTEALRSLATAAITSLSGTADPSERHAALQYCESFKAQGGRTCALYGLQLAGMSPDNPELSSVAIPEARLFGFQLLDHCIKTQWNDYNDGDKQEFKETLLGQLAINIRPNDDVFLLEKLAAVVSAAALRDWPQRWPDLVSRLESLCSYGTAHTYFALAALRTLAEDIITYGEDMSNSRRQDLTKALKVCAADIMKFVTSILQSAGMLPASSIKAALKTLAAYLDWTPVDEIFKHNVLGGLILFLNEPSLRRDAAECLVLIADRKGPKDERYPLLGIFDQLDQILSTVPNAMIDGAVDEEALLFIKAMCQFVVSLGSAQLIVLWGSSRMKKGAPPKFDVFLQALYTFARHPSMVVSVTTLPLWNQLLKHDQALANDTMKQALMPLFHLFVERMVRPVFDGDDADESNETVLYCQHEFDDDEDFAPFFAMYRSHLCGLLRTISHLRPRETVDVAAQSLSVALDLRPGPAELDAQGHIKPTSNTFRIWDALTCIWEAVVTGSFPVIEASIAKGHKSHAAGVLRQCFEMAIVRDSQDPLFLLCELGVIEAMLPVLRLVPEGLPHVVAKLFASAEFRAQEDRLEQDEQEHSNSKVTLGLSDGAKVRRKACSTLVTLCRHPPPRFHDSLEDICGRVQRLMASPFVSEMQRRLLTEALLNSFNSLPSPEIHRAAISQFIGPVASDFAGPEVTRIVSSAQALADFGGLLTPQADKNDCRMQMTMLLSAIMVTLRVTRGRGADGLCRLGSNTATAQSSPPVSGSDSGQASRKSSPGKAAGGSSSVDVAGTNGAASARPKTKMTGEGGCAVGGTGDLFVTGAVARMVLPNLSRLMSTIHSMWIPEQSIFPPQLSALLQLRRSEVAAQLTGVVSGASTKEMTAEEAWFDRSQLWLHSMREWSYISIGHCARTGVLYESLESFNAAASSCLYGLEHVHKRHLHMLLKHVSQPLIQFAPRDPARMSIIAEPVVRLFNFLHTTITEGFAAKASRASSQQSAAGAGGSVDSSLPGPSEQAELVEDKLLRDLAQETVSQVCMILSDTDTEPGTDRAYAHTLGSTAQGLLNQPSTALPLLRILCDALTWELSAPARSAAMLLASLVSAFEPHQAFHPFLSEHVLPAALIGLGKHGQHSECESNMLTVVWKSYEIVGQQPSTQAVLQQFQGIDVAQLQALLSLATPRTTLGLKRKRQQLRKILQPIIGVNIGQAGRVKVRILDLPERLLLPSTGSNGDENEDPDFDSSVLFGPSK